MPSFVISGGDFLRTEGCLSFVDLDDRTGQLALRREVWISHPRPEMAVPGKGITGLCLDGAAAWACFSNVVVRLDLSSGEVLDLIEDEAFNDLHQLGTTEGGLILANTGNESVDLIALPERTITRVDLLGDHLRARRPRREQDQDTKPHLHHVASACRNADGDLIVGLGRQARILNATRWEWVGPSLGAGLHDVHCTPDRATWCTTVGGEVHRLGDDGVHRSWRLEHYQEQVGWTRGLAITDEGMLVGTTAIRESNRDYYQALVQAEVGTVDAGLVWIPFGEGAASWLKLPGGRTRKVFAVCWA